MKVFAFLLVIVLCSLYLSAIEPKQSKPNIIVIMADDLGYGDLSCYGADRFSTPNIDKLASGGLRFTNGYCSAATCTPTRFSFMTGKYAFRQKGTGIGGINTTSLIQPGTVTLPSLLKQAGYATAVVGKWHLGLGAPPAPNWNGSIKPGPLEIGFDYSFLLPNTNDRVPSVYVENHHVLNLDPADPLTVSNKNPDDQPTGNTHRETLKLDWSHGHNSTIHNGISRIGFMAGGHAARWRDEDLADEFVKKSVEWIEAHKDKPFFLFFSSHDIHVPRMPHERFQGKTPLGYRADAILELDYCVGELVKTLDRLNLTQKTLIVFCSDNGPVLDDGYKDGAVEKLGSHKPAGPFSGGKYSPLEGGTHTPFITYWPGTIKKGVSDKMVSTIDLAHSFASLVGQSLPSNACPDSFNLLPALLGKPNAKGREYIVEHAGASIGLRLGHWKLIRKGSKKNKKVNYVLYNLENDIAERKNVIENFPAKAEELKSLLEKITTANKTRS